ncbi:hypothetical protein HOG17_01985 [Candidatus Peregrinibacteria bacterium]|jgi:hypothetical protein|nr:hypothetical protein [Candidatus Peregrinibacteria bacterium]MBT4147798.1 hypothetical protein [Candidatus Peregrinibacteria bacterium]MBT4366309.1 hypothetical protein [Candidatus Peregrinibacteria bacterium]MBT4456516.1 hypothetical protein [Candidatus Peregrinibacteria bacterium]
MEQNQPTQTKKPPLGIKIMAGILLLIGLVIGFDVLSSISAILFGGWMLVTGIVALILFIYTEKTSINMFKMKSSNKINYYIALFLDMLYICSMPLRETLILTHETPSADTFLVAIILTVIVFAVLALPFFFITRKHKDLYV